TWQVVVVGRSEEAVPLREDLEDPLREDQPVLLGLSFEDLENQLLLSQAARALDSERVGQLHQLRNGAALELDDVEALGGCLRTVCRGRRRGRRWRFCLLLLHFALRLLDGGWWRQRLSAATSHLGWWAGHGLLPRKRPSRFGGFPC